MGVSPSSDGRTCNVKSWTSQRGPFDRDQRTGPAIRSPGRGVVALRLGPRPLRRRGGAARPLGLAAVGVIPPSSKTAWDPGAPYQGQTADYRCQSQALLLTIGQLKGYNALLKSCKKGGQG